MEFRKIQWRSVSLLPSVLLFLLIVPETGQAQSDHGYIEANGINYYYEIHGEGEPLLLLHGGLGSIDMFASILPILTQNRKVIGVDLQGHGRTELGNRSVSYIDMGDDMAVLLEELGYGQIDVLGYSMGGGVALRLAIQHPEIVRRLVPVSASFASDGFYPEIIQQQRQVNAEAAEAMINTPMYQSYKKVAPNPEDFPKLLDRLGELMHKSYDWTENIEQLKMPVMLIYGDSDMFRYEHIVEFYQLLGGGLKDAGWQREHMSQNRLAVLPNLTHYEIFMAPILAETALSFFNAESEAPSWNAGSN
jgi:pimeloyl-ACP methyl ester carboxylesterase